MLHSQTRPNNNKNNINQSSLSSSSSLSLNCAKEKLKKAMHHSTLKMPLPLYRPSSTELSSSSAAASVLKIANKKNTGRPISAKSGKIFAKVDLMAKNECSRNRNTNASHY